MTANTPSLEAASCTTDSGSHHSVGATLLDQGLHLLCEKPLALTMRGCRQVSEAAIRNDRLLSIAENYRRDPMNRLVKALIDDGAIGEPQSILEAFCLGKDEIFITPWRHQKLTGTITLDAGVHNADILQYYFGDAHSAFGQSRIFHPTRVPGNTSGPGGFYEKWADTLPDQIEATGEDALFGLITFENGAIGQWTQNHAGHGQPVAQRDVYGTTGSITAPGDRNGNPVSLHLDDGQTISDEQILDYAPSYRLESVAASLFGSERPWHYAFDFPETDRKLLALEYAELAQCVREDSPPEVDAATATRAVALVYSIVESQFAGRPVTIEEIESGKSIPINVR